MGAVHFSLDPRLARLLQETLRFEVFVETGTGYGDTVAAVRPLFSEIHTIEQDESLACPEVLYLIDFIRSSQRGVILRRSSRRAEEVIADE